MTVTIVRKEALLDQLARIFRVEGADRTQLFRRVVAQAVRRASYILAPCAQSRLLGAVAGSLRGIGPSDEEVEQVVADVIEHLIVFGDLLEMRSADSDVWESSYILRPAPPAFIMRPDGGAFIVGVAGDDISPLSSDLEPRLYHNGLLQVLRPAPDEDLRLILSDLGLAELKESVWLRIPPAQDPASYLKTWQDQLASQSLASSIDGLSVVDPGQPRHFYKGRWTMDLRGLNGTFVARRPQTYGAPIWCLVQLGGGRLLKFLDFTSKGDRVRPSDIAWRVQLALDAVGGAPQQFALDQGAADAVLSFFAPLPSWVERRLATSGTMLGKVVGALFSFKFQTSDIAEQTKFLREHVWLEERTLRGGMA
jgi:hypothetical protein